MKFDPATKISTLGKCEYDSPILKHAQVQKLRDRIFICDNSRVLSDNTICAMADDDKTPENCRPGCIEHHDPEAQICFEQGGPREKIFFDPSKVRAGIVTCGGICPGLNNVIYAITLALWHNYNVQQIFGFPYGYGGLYKECGHQPIPLTPKLVDGWQQIGGTQLGSSRGSRHGREMADYMQHLRINILFVVGGDGTMRGALETADEVAKRNGRIAIVGIPKTIDNDIIFLDETFGFRSAVEEGAKAIECAHVEANGAENGIGLVKLMGRDSGFVACQAALATGFANFVLVPELEFDLDKLLEAVKARLRKRKHAVIVVAEGAGQEHFNVSGKDASGNKNFGDIGTFLRDHITKKLKEEKFTHSLKYFDPSYIIRSVKANAQDATYCLQLGQDAVHAAMAGKTAMLLGTVNAKMCHIPMTMVVNKRKKVNPLGDLWRMVMQSTGQGNIFASDKDFVFYE